MSNPGKAFYMSMSTVVSIDVDGTHLKWIFLFATPINHSLSRLDNGSPFDSFQSILLIHNRKGILAGYGLLYFLSPTLHAFCSLIDILCSISCTYYWISQQTCLLYLMKTQRSSAYSATQQTSNISHITACFNNPKFLLRDDFVKITSTHFVNQSHNWSFTTLM
jgi:hypothetical protein